MHRKYCGTLTELLPSSNTLKKLVTILKSRYSGERQADKYRAELQIRRREANESLSELHQDIRRLLALAYPKLTADAREEIANLYYDSGIVCAGMVRLSGLISLP